MKDFNLDELKNVKIELIDRTKAVNDSGEFDSYTNFYGGWENNPFFGQDGNYLRYRLDCKKLSDLKVSFFAAQEELISLGYDPVLFLGDNATAKDKREVRFANNNTTYYFSDKAPPLLRLSTFRLLAQHLNREGKELYYTAAYLAGFISAKTYDAIKNNMEKINKTFINTPEKYLERLRLLIEGQSSDNDRVGPCFNTAQENSPCSEKLAEYWNKRNVARATLFGTPKAVKLSAAKKLKNILENICEEFSIDELKAIVETTITCKNSALRQAVIDTFGNASIEIVSKKIKELPKNSTILLSAENLRSNEKIVFK